MPKYICATCSEEAVAESKNHLYCAKCALDAKKQGEDVKIGLTHLSFNPLTHLKVVPDTATLLFSSVKNTLSKVNESDTVSKAKETVANSTLTAAAKIKSLFTKDIEKDNE